MRSFPNFGVHVAEVLAGTVQAFKYTASNSYVASFGLPAYLVPIAFAAVVWQLGRIDELALRTRLATMLPVIAAGVAGLLALAPVHLAHMKWEPQWLFHWRHGLPLVLLIVPSLAFRARLHRFVRVGLAAVVASGLLLPATTPEDWVRNRSLDRTWPAEQSLIEWLEAHPKPPRVISRRIRMLAAYGAAVGDEVPCWSKLDNLWLYFELLPIDYLIVSSGDSAYCPTMRKFMRDEATARHFELVRTFGDADDGSILVLRRADSAGPSAAR